MLSVLIFGTLSIAQTAPFEIEIIKKEGKVLPTPYRNLNLKTKGAKLSVAFKDVNDKNEKFTLKAAQTLANGKYLKYTQAGDHLNILSITYVKSEYIYKHIRVDLSTQTIVDERIIKRLHTKHSNYTIETFSIKENHIFIHASPNMAGEEEQIMVLDEKFNIQHDLQINFYDEIKRILQKDIDDTEENIKNPPDYYQVLNHGASILESKKEKLKKLQIIEAEMEEGKTYPSDFSTFILYPYNYNGKYITLDLGYSLSQSPHYYVPTPNFINAVNFLDKTLLDTETKKSISLKKFAHLNKEALVLDVELFEDVIQFKSYEDKTTTHHAFYIDSEIDLTLRRDTTKRKTDNSIFTIDEHVFLDVNRVSEFQFISTSILAEYIPSKYDSTQTELGVKYSYSTNQNVRMHERYISITLENYKGTNTVTNRIPLPVLKDELYYGTNSGSGRSTNTLDFKNDLVLHSSLTNNYLHLTDGNYIYVAIPRIRVKYNNENQPKAEYFGYDVFCIDARTGDYSSTKFFYPKHSGIYSGAELSKNDQGEIILTHPNVEMIYFIQKK
ncbi:hypothetical protein SAMN05216474_0174 [Lishizhenia tianjinensis]|uniref:Uncharacterized protein n=2 Tax=Lishizhenia tianjinensis TaxID=477690 RepID=A0A1I6XGR4_9FLAO|nr:hypothetical protein SAMN05216474_0174 [Lishizhenia tianjinensis]